MIVGTFPDKIELPLTVPEKACAGHFPGNPLVPGVLQLQLVAEALGVGEASKVSISAVPRLRFRKPIVPGDDSRIEAQRSGATWRFRIVNAKRIVTEGSLEVAELPALPLVDGPPPSTEDFERIQKTLPHREPMLLIRSFLETGDGWGVCAGSISEAAPFARKGMVPAVAAFEVAAQALGAVEGASHPDGDTGEARMGLLVGISNARLAASSFPVDSQLRAQVERTAWVPPMARAEARVTTGDQEVATCTLTTWTPGLEVGSG